MKVYYSISVQMYGTYEVTDSVLETAAHHLGFTKNDIEETDVHCTTVMFSSNVLPTEMRDRVRRLIVAEKRILYVDVMYRFEYAMIPDRFVIWRDGRSQEYTGHVHFEEDNEYGEK